VVSGEKQRSRRRRLAWGAVLALVSAVIAWQIAERAIAVDRYRPQIEEALARFTGQPVSIGDLDLAWHPVPCLSAFEVSIGTGDFRATAARLDVFPVLRALFAWRLEIASIELIEPVLTLPPTPGLLASEWRRTLAHMKAARAGSPPRDADFRIHRVLAEQASLRFGSGDPHPILASVTASGIGTDAIALELELEIPSAGARATGTLVVPAGEGGGLRGELAVSGVRPDRLATLPELLHSEWQARVELSGSLARELRVKIDGRFEPRSPHAIGGTVSGRARVAPGGATRVELDVGAEGLAMRGSGRLFAGNRSKLRIDSLTARGAALAALLASLSSGEGGLRAAPDAALEVRDLELAIAGARRPRLVSGGIEARGIEASWNEHPLASDLHLDAQVADGAIRIAEIRGGPVDLRGVITPDTEWRRFALDLTGSVGVSDALLHALGVPETVRDTAGVVTLEELRAELPAPADAPVRFTLRAHLADGSLRFDTDAVSESVSGVDVRLAGGADALRVEARALAAALGPLSVAADVEPAEGRARGTLALTAGVGAGFLRDERARRRIAPVLRAYGSGAFDFTVERVPDTAADHRIRIERAQAPRVTAALLLRSGRRRDRVRDVDVAAELPGDALRGFLSEAAQTSGAGSLRVRRPGSDKAFSVEADLSGLGVAVGEFVEKKPGEPLRVRAEGKAGSAGWTPTRLVVASGESSVPLVLTESGITATDLDLDLGAWSFLLVDSARASGHLRGAFDSATAAAQLQLAEVALQLTPDVGVDAVDGAIEIAGDDWSVRELRIRDAQSDAVLDGAVRQGHVEGSLRGPSLDLDFVRALVEQVDALVPEDEHDAPPRISGDLAVALDRVGYGRGEARNLVAAIAVADGDIHMRDLAFDAAEGRVTGQVDLDAREEQPSQLALELDFTDVTGPFLDELFSEQPRGLRGVFTGKLHFAAPLHDDYHEILAAAGGSLTVTGRDGTFGRLGITTKIVTVLRSTETLRLKLLVIRDEGLVYDTAKAELVMEQGRLAIRAFDLDSTSYALTATGEIDFRGDRSKVGIEVNAIKGITGIVDQIPVAGDALKIVSVRLVATGSPYDMKVGVASITDQLLGVGMAGPKAVINGVRDALRLLRGATTSPEPAPVPSPEPAPEAAASPAPEAAPEAAPVAEDEPPPAPEVPETPR